MAYSVKCNNLDDTENLAKTFANAILDIGAFVSLYGDIGAGKTTFTKFICKYLDVKEKVTSPSFVILNEYKTGKLPVYHFDLYRLEKEGISTIINELEEYSEGKILTIVEWAQFSENAVPFDRLELNINYIDGNKREFTFNAIGKKSEKLMMELETL